MRRSANSAAVIVAPVGPALASACERPSATSAAREHDRGLRRVAHGADRIVVVGDRIRRRDHLDARRRPRARRARPDRRTRARRSRRPPRHGPRRRSPRPPLGPAAVEGDRLSPATPDGASPVRVGFADLVHDHLAPGVGAAGRADAMRQPRAVAARALVQPRLRRRVRRAALVAALRGGSFLRDGHRDAEW